MKIGDALFKEQKIYDSMLLQFIWQNEANSLNLLKIMNGNGEKQFGSYTTYEGYKDYDAFDFGNLVNKKELRNQLFLYILGILF